MKTAKTLFRRRDRLARQLAEIDAQLLDARRNHYSYRGALPRMESFRREVGA